MVRYELRIGDGSVQDIYFQGTGCCISQASASMLAERMDGKPLAEVKEFAASDMLELFGARLTPNRQKCCLLPWRVLQSTLYSPIDEDDAAGRSPTAAGPNLGEES